MPYFGGARSPTEIWTGSMKQLVATARRWAHGHPNSASLGPGLHRIFRYPAAPLVASGGSVLMLFSYDQDPEPPHAWFEHLSLSWWTEAREQAPVPWEEAEAWKGLFFPDGLAERLQNPGSLVIHYRRLGLLRP